MKPIIVMLAALLAGCASRGGAPVAKSPAGVTPPPALLVSLQRDRCFGSCPAYRLEIDTDGAVRFDARAYLCTEGPEAFRLPPETVAALRAAIARSGFATTPEHCCDCPIADTSDLTLTVADRAPPKTIVDSDCAEAPTTVRDLAQAIEAIVGIERWIGTKEERDGCR
jgi:uncharacterized protein DUF6438